MGSALSTFNDFVDTTGPSFLTSARGIVNEAVKNTYLLSRFLRGRPDAHILKGGRVIRDTLLLDEDSTAENYLPNQTFTWRNPQVVENWEGNWRFTTDHMSWTDQEIILNINDGMSKQARHQAYKNMKWVKEQRLWTSILNFMEDKLTAVPDTAEMETETGTDQYSLFSFINEWDNGQYGEDAGGVPAGTTPWTTIQGLNPTTSGFAKWAPAQVTYDQGDLVTTGTQVEEAFDEMFQDVKFVPPPTRQEYFENENMSGQFIITSKVGITWYQKRLRESQDQFVTTGRQDPAYINPQYAGIDVLRISNLDDKAIYPDSTVTNTPVTEGDAGAGVGPRYYWVNARYLCPVYHTERYYTQHPTMRHPNQPYTTIKTCDTWWNMVARSRQRHGVVYPGGAAFTAYTP
jgi:hypothetical protein